MLEIGELDTSTGKGSPVSRLTPDASAMGKKWLSLVASPTTRLDALAGEQGWKRVCVLQAGVQGGIVSALCFSS